MGFKHKIVWGVIAIVLMVVAFTLMYPAYSKARVDYSQKIIHILNQQEETTFKDIFDFNFDRAYVFDDAYISGEGFTKRYNLPISINEVGPGYSENIQRIIFVDDQGCFIYAFQCDSSNLLFDTTGIIVYPETIIQNESEISGKPLIISFNGQLNSLDGSSSTD